MLRLTMALVSFLGCVSFAPALFTSPRTEPGLKKDLSRQVQKEVRADTPKRELVITAETEIKVNGKACRLDSVPAGAEIILLDVAADRSVIRRIHFQTKK
jgi:hypothetical protein